MKGWDNSARIFFSFMILLTLFFDSTLIYFTNLLRLRHLFHSICFWGFFVNYFPYAAEAPRTDLEQELIVVPFFGFGDIEVMLQECWPLWKSFHRHRLHQFIFAGAPAFNTGSDVGRFCHIGNLFKFDGFRLMKSQRFGELREEAIGSFR